VEAKGMISGIQLSIYITWGEQIEIEFPAGEFIRALSGIRLIRGSKVRAQGF